MTVGTKVTVTFLLMAGLVVLAGIAGYIGTTRLGTVLDTVSGPIWQVLETTYTTQTSVTRQILAVDRLIAGGVAPERRRAEVERIEEGDEALDQSVRRLREAAIVEGSVLEELDRRITLFRDQRRALLEASRPGGEGVEAHANSYRAAAGALLDQLEVLTVQVRLRVDSQRPRIEEAKALARNGVQSSSLAGLILALVAALYGIASIGRPLRKVTAAIVAFSEGRTDVAPPDADRSDEIGDLVRALTAMIDRVQGREASLRTLAVQHATAIRETTQTVLQLKAASAQAQEIAARVLNSVDNTVSASSDGIKATEEAAAGIGRLSGRVGEMTGTVQSLSTQMEEIGSIVALVNDLAEQAKFLSLNAAIEAARAGDAGRGFGVVAVEVRSLAQQSQEATRRIRELIEDIQGAVRDAVEAAAAGNDDARRGRAVVQMTEEAFGAMASAVEEVRVSAHQILASVNQQMLGIDQIAGAMQEIDTAMATAVEANVEVDRGPSP